MVLSMASTLREPVAADDGAGWCPRGRDTPTALNHSVCVAISGRLVLEISDANENCPRAGRAATVGAVVPVIWAVGSQAVPASGVVQPIAEPWIEHPWPVAVAASALAFVAADR